jgi:hypothetical protein
VIHSYHVASVPRQVRTCPETGREELIVLSGFTVAGLAPMAPHALDLCNFRWRRGPQQPAAEVPQPRQRASVARVGARWLLVAGGVSHQVGSTGK